MCHLLQNRLDNLFACGLLRWQQRHDVQPTATGSFLQPACFAAIMALTCKIIKQTGMWRYAAKSVHVHGNITTQGGSSSCV